MPERPQQRREREAETDGQGTTEPRPLVGERISVVDIEQIDLAPPGALRIAALGLELFMPAAVGIRVVVLAAIRLVNRVGRPLFGRDLVTPLVDPLRQIGSRGRILGPPPRRLVGIGKAVTVTVPDNGKQYQGTITSVNENGALRLRQDDGSMLTVLAGDVTLR